MMILSSVLCAASCLGAAPLPESSFIVHRVPNNPSRLTLNSTLNFTYDDNVFQYSPQDETTFIRHANEGYNPERYAYVRSLDDVIANMEMAATWRPTLIKHHTTEVILAVDGRDYTSNPVKSYMSANIDFRQFFSRSFDLEASGLLLPYYLIRNYHNLSGTGWSPCVFSEQLYDLKAGWQAADWVNLAPFARYEDDIYRSPFEPYDTKALRTGADIDISFIDHCSSIIVPRSSSGPALGALLEYEFKDAWAAGPTPDISYRQHTAGIKFHAASSKPGAWNLDLGYDFSWRGYTATFPVDSTHTGRVDHINRLAGQFNVRLTRGLSLVADLGREWRSAKAPYNSDIDEVKDYTENIIGVGVKYVP
jgi:hypothetical protein